MDNGRMENNMEKGKLLLPMEEQELVFGRMASILEI